jgi:hypothetical protein
MPGWRQVDDRQAGVGEAALLVAPDALVIWTTVAYCFDHSSQPPFGVERRPTGAKPEKSTDAAHVTPGPLSQNLSKLLAGDLEPNDQMVNPPANDRRKNLIYINVFRNFECCYPDVSNPCTSSELVPPKQFVHAQAAADV